MLPAVIDGLSGSDDLRTARLLTVLQAVGNLVPRLLAEHWKRVWAVSKMANFQRHLLLIRLMEKVFEEQQMPGVLKDEIEHLRLNYSSSIRISSYRLLTTSPSPKFLVFLRKATLFDFGRKLDGVTEFLGLDKYSVLADLERRLYAEGWNIEAAEDEREDDWDGNVHPQGWPVVWVEPHFHTHVSSLLYAALDEYVQNMRFREPQIEAIWRVIQPADPEFMSYPVQVKPDDIPPLFVNDKDLWLRELQNEDEIVFNQLPREGWITLFEYRRSAQDTKYEVPYVKETWTVTALIDPVRTIGVDQLRSVHPWEEPLVAFHPDECLTWEQARQLLTGSQDSQIDPRGITIPAISLKQNPSLFPGFQFIASLPSYIIRECRSLVQDLRSVRSGATGNLL